MNSLQNSIEGIQDGEQKVCEIRKHPFGIILLYIEVVLGLAAGLGLLYFLLPQFITDGNRHQLNNLLLLAVAGSVAVTLIILLLAGVIYNQSYLIVTDRNVTQVLQKGLFNRQVSELSMANIEDVTAAQKGIFATLFNYGKLVIETAGEQNNFIFTYCPRPNYYGKILLDARQRYIQGDPLRAKTENDRLNVPPPSLPPPQMPPAASYS